MNGDAHRFKPYTCIDFQIILHIRNHFHDGTHIAEEAFLVPRESDAAIIQLILEGFGRPSDRLSIRAYQKDRQDLVTTVNLQLLIPLCLATAILITGAAAALIIQPKRSMAFQPSVRVDQLMSCARARETNLRMTRLGTRNLS